MTSGEVSRMALSDANPFPPCQDFVLCSVIGSCKQYGPLNPGPEVIKNFHAQFSRV